MAAEVSLRGADGVAEWAEEVAGEEGERRQIAESVTYAQADGELQGAAGAGCGTGRR